MEATVHNMDRCLCECVFVQQREAFQPPTAPCQEKTQRAQETAQLASQPLEPRVQVTLVTVFL